METRLDLLKIFEEVFNSFFGLLIVDKDGKIVSIANNYATFLGYPDAEVLIGRLVEEVIPNTRMMETIRTGVADIADVWHIHGETIIINRIPLRINGEIVGAIAFDVFGNTQQAFRMSRSVYKSREAKSAEQDARQSWRAKYGLSDILGISPYVQNIKRQIGLVADAECPVLIYGETGTGKELVAHALHSESQRRDQPFVRVNCAGIPENLWESELFGYEEGAFTGARRGGKMGKFELADGGTLFLDEISELPLYAQAKLLRVLEGMEIDRVGSERLRQVDVRLIAATNKHLDECVAQGTFREDLYYRLNVYEIEIAPLRERREDIPVIAQHFAAKSSYRLGHDVRGIGEEALYLLQHYDWPGNVRELLNTVERACLIQHSGFLNEEVFFRVKPALAKGRGETKKPCLKGAKQEAERLAILKALAEAEGNRTVAAKNLGIHRTWLYQKMRELNISEVDIDLYLQHRS